MQFRLRSLLIVTALVAVFCAVAFAVPIGLTVILFAIGMMVAPSAWIVGAWFGRGAWRPFFVGGIIAGLLPNLVVATYGYAVMASGFDSITSGDMWVSVGSETSEIFAARIYCVAIFLTPGVFAALGGGLGVLVYRLCGPLPHATAPTSDRTSAAPTYVVIEGRIRGPSQDVSMTELLTPRT